MLLAFAYEFNVGRLDAYAFEKSWCLELDDDISVTAVLFSSLRIKMNI